MTAPTQNTIQQKMFEAIAAAAEETKYPAMTYEQGVESALRWILGEGDDPLSD